MKRVLLISPHFPPDSSAGAHRVRLLAPHLSEWGWEPTVLTLEPEAYEGALDWELARLTPPSLRVVRVPAWSFKTTRCFGLGDLGLRALHPLRSAASRLLSAESYDLLFVTIYPSYPAILGPALRRKHRIPFVLDYQDPWVGSWGLKVGGGRNGAPDLKSRLTRRVAAFLEPQVLRRTDALTAVSSGTYEEIFHRHPEFARLPCEAIPLGLEPSDFEALRAAPRPNPWFDPNDGLFHIIYAGTLLPLGFETLRGLFAALQELKTSDPACFSRLRLHFFGSSNQSTPNPPARVLPIAVEFGLGGTVTEVPARISYLDALSVLTQSSAILLLGSSEPHYTASKIYPALLARRPILALYHQESSVVEILRAVAKAPTVQVVTYGVGSHGPLSRAAEIQAALRAWGGAPSYNACDVSLSGVESVSARALSGKLARIFDRVTA